MKTPPTESFFLNGQTKYIEIGVDKYFLWHWSKSVVGKNFDICTSISFLPTTQLEHRAAGL